MIKYRRISTVLLVATVFVSSCKVVEKSATPAAPVPVQSVSNNSAVDSDKQKEFQYLYVEGVKQRTIGNIDEAVKIFSQCLEMDPNSAAAMYEIANIHVSKGDYQSSMMMLEKAVSINPDNKYYHILLAKLYQQNKLYDKAAAEYKTLEKIEPNVIEYPYYQASMLGMAGKTTDAIATYNLLEKRMGISEMLSIGKQQLYLQAGNKAAAYKEIEKLIAAYPAEPKYYGLLADMYLNDGQREKAFENYNRILQVDPDDGFVHLSIANFYKEGGDMAKAYEHIKIAFSKSSLEFETKGQMFVLLTQPGENKISDEQQVELIKILIDTHIDDERPFLFYYDYFYNKKDFQQAREQLRHALDIKKDNYEYWERLLMVDNELLDWKSLSDDSKTAAIYFPEQPLIYLLDAVALLQLGKIEEMYTVLDNGQVYAANNPKLLAQFYLYRAEALYKEKKQEEAFKMYDLVMANDPQNWMAMNNYAYYLSLLNLKLELAEKMSGTVIQNNPDNATYLDTYAWVLFKKKDYRLAKFYIESAINNDKESSAVLIEHYGDILYFLDDKENAVVQWKKSLEMGNKSQVLPEKINKIIYIESPEEP
jgi:tetratricopeptide (TPR) repeat protein